MRLQTCVTIVLLFEVSFIHAWIDWTSCPTKAKRNQNTETNILNPIHSNLLKRQGETIERAEGVTEECAFVTVPYDWNGEYNGTFTLATKRFLVEGAERQIWVVPGGPGEASIGTLDPLIRIFAVQFNVNFYILDLRGVGQSTPIYCNNTLHEKNLLVDGSAELYEECKDELVAKYSDILPYMTTTNAAKDYHYVIHNTQNVTGHWTFFAYSYGTFLTNRYLQLFPDDLAGVTLDGCMLRSTNTETLLLYDFYHENIFQKILEDCKTDTFCKSKLGNDPANFVLEVKEKLSTGHCAEAMEAWGGWTAEPNLLQRLVRYSMLPVMEENNPYSNRILMLAIIYRFNRCNADDITVLKLWGNVFSQSTAQQKGSNLISAYNYIIGMHMILSDVYPAQPPSLATFQNDLNDTFMGPPIFSLTQRTIHDDWPIAPAEPEFDFKFNTADVPHLLLQGDLDPQTPLENAEDAANHLEDVQLVVVPTDAHITAIGHSGLTCAGAIGMNFLVNPILPANTSCIVNKSLKFEGQATAEAWELDDLWENAEETTAATDSTTQQQEESNAPTLAHVPWMLLFPLLSIKYWIM